VSGTRSIGLFAILAALAVALGACGGDDEETTTSSTTTTSTTTTADCTPAQAEVDQATGEFAGLDLDCREGTPPAPVAIEDLADAAEAGNCDLELDLPDEGNTHIPASKPTSYETSPPTSGDHDQVPLADGAYAETPEERYFVHSMEHGRVLILYNPDLPEEDQLALKGVFDEDPDGVAFFPYPDMPYDVAATAWAQLLGCETYGVETLDAIRDFRDEFRGNGPEAVPL
jgi:hypothetical protein